MQPQHGTAKVGITGTGIEYALTRLQVNGRQEHLSTASLSSPLHDSIAVFSKLLAIKMAMGIDVVHRL
jgi:hypothetical protein